MIPVCKGCVLIDGKMVGEIKTIQLENESGAGTHSEIIDSGTATLTGTITNISKEGRKQLGLPITEPKKRRAKTHKYFGKNKKRR